jgi:N-acetylmuramoyl-L-alanine amidase
VIAAFQMKYRPAKYDGEPDAETAALLEAVTRPDGLQLRVAGGGAQPYRP